MKKYLVTYYSKTGNNKFIAERIAESLEADLLQIKPRFNYIFLQFIFSMLGIRTSINLTSSELSPYDELVVCGPIYGGLLISPLFSVIKKGVKAAKPIHFITCPGGSDEERNKKFGYARVLKKVNLVANRWLKSATAIPVTLVLDSEKRQVPNAVMHTRLSASNYDGIFKKRLEKFITGITSNSEISV